MRTFKQHIGETDLMIDERIDTNAHNYSVNMSQLQGLMTKFGKMADTYASTENAVGKDNGREVMDDCKLIISLVKKLRRG